VNLVRQPRAFLPRTHYRSEPAKYFDLLDSGEVQLQEITAPPRREQQAGCRVS
jgi:hypothetical protein